MKKGKTMWTLVGFFVIISMASCLKSDTRESIPVPGECSGTPGPLFKAMRTLVSNKCVSCHNSIISNGGMNFSIECNIVVNRAMIKVKAVDEGSMPPTGTLPLADKVTITNWINAGGKYTD